MSRQNKVAQDLKPSVSNYRSGPSNSKPKAVKIKSIKPGYKANQNKQQPS